MTYEQLYEALGKRQPVQLRDNPVPLAIVKIVPTGTERWQPETGALVQVFTVGVPLFWARGADVVPVGRAK